MSVTAADLSKAIVAAWNASDLNQTFLSLRPLGGTVAPVLCDGEAAPGQQMPYCIFVLDDFSSLVRMTGDIVPRFNFDIREATWEFQIYAADVVGDDRSAKEIAAFLAEQVIRVFGGSPIKAPTASITMDNGQVVLMRYVSDRGERQGDNEWLWVVEYNVWTDFKLMF